MSRQRTIIVPVIAGPTASGKTDLSLALAERFEGLEIVSADSRQIYTGMDIGTAKPTPDDLRRVPHHMIDIVAPDRLYSAGEYAGAARMAIADILERGGVPLVVGGSGFYIKALFEGLGAPSADQDILRQLQERGGREGFERLYEELQAVDPVAAAAHSPNNHVKTLRALCCYHQTGIPYSTFLARESIQVAPFKCTFLGLSPEREQLYRRINRRVLTMLEQGLVEETKRLVEVGYDRSTPGLKTVGYAEVLAWLAGEIAEERMIELIKQSTRRYAKRQMTWLRRMEGVFWMQTPDLERASGWMQGALSAV